MVKKKDIVKMFVIYLSLCHVCPAHPCGDNPLRSVINISSKTGRALPSVLGTLRTLNGVVYRKLQWDFQNYAECIGMVDTGYFKRSLGSFSSHYRKHSVNDDDVISRYASRQISKRRSGHEILKETRNLLVNVLLPLYENYEKRTVMS